MSISLFNKIFIGNEATLQLTIIKFIPESNEFETL